MRNLVGIVLLIKEQENVKVSVNTGKRDNYSRKKQFDPW
jgi:hypothetical protein